MDNDLGSSSPYKTRNISVQRCQSPSKLLDMRAKKLKSLFEVFFSPSSLKSAEFASQAFSRVQYDSDEQCDSDMRIVSIFPEDKRVGGSRHLFIRANTLFGRIFSHDTTVGPVNPKPRERMYGNAEFIGCSAILFSRFGGDMCLPNVYVACPYVYRQFFGTDPQELWTDEKLMDTFAKSNGREGRKRDFSDFMRPGSHTIFPVNCGSHWSVVVVLYADLDAPKGENTVFFGVDNLVCHNMAAIAGNIRK